MNKKKYPDSTYSRKRSYYYKVRCTLEEREEIKALINNFKYNNTKIAVSEIVINALKAYDHGK